MLGKFCACTNSVYQAFSFTEGLGTRLALYVPRVCTLVLFIAIVLLHKLSTQPICLLALTVILVVRSHTLPFSRPTGESLVLLTPLSSTDFLVEDLEGCPNEGNDSNFH